MSQMLQRIGELAATASCCISRRESCQSATSRNFDAKQVVRNAAERLGLVCNLQSGTKFFTGVANTPGVAWSIESCKIALARIYTAGANGINGEAAFSDLDATPAVIAEAITKLENGLLACSVTTTIARVNDPFLRFRVSSLVIRFTRELTVDGSAHYRPTDYRVERNSCARPHVAAILRPPSDHQAHDQGVECVSSTGSQS